MSTQTIEWDPVYKGTTAYNVEGDSMKGIGFGLFFLLLAQWAYSQPSTCVTFPFTGEHSDTVLTSSDGAPFDPAALNAVIAQVDTTTTNCTQYNFRLRVNADTLYLSNPIDLGPAETIPFTFFVERCGANCGVADNTVRVVVRRSSGSASSAVMTISSPNVIVANVEYLQGGGNSAPLVDVQAGADNTRIRNSHFELTAGDGVGVSVASSTVLVERTYFRSQLGTYGATDRPTGINLAGTAAAVDIRSNLFYSAGITLASHGFNVGANTFVGEAGSGRFFIELTGGATGGFYIQHNHFAQETPATPIAGLGGTISAGDVIQNNGYSGPSLTTGAGAATQVNNVALPRGLSDYSLGDYPLEQMRTDLTLDAQHADFGRVPLVYNAFSGAIPQILNNNTLLATFNFPTNFLDFSGSLYSGGMLIGCFADFGATIYKPSPVDGIAFSISGLTIARSTRTYDDAFYAIQRPPTNIYYLMSKDSTALAAGNDTTLESAAVFWDHNSYDITGAGTPSGSDNAVNNALNVPHELRLDTNPIFVKMVHRRLEFAHSLAAETTPFAVARVDGMPVYPVSDFNLTNTSTPTNLANGIVNLQYTGGLESIDSLHIQMVTLTNTVVLADTIDPAITPTPTYSGLPQGTVIIKATPIGYVAGTRYEGTDTAFVDTVDLRVNLSDTLYVDLTGKVCTGQEDGTINNAYCDLVTALNRARSGNTIYIQYSNIATTVLTNLNFSASPTNIKVVSDGIATGTLSARRPIIRGLTLNQTGIEIHGFIIEKTAVGTPAATISADGVVLEGNLFRGTDGAGTEVNHAGVVIDIRGTVVTDVVNLRNNVIYGGLPSVNVASPADIRVVNNTFVEPLGETPICFLKDGLYSSPDNPAIIIANNFFTGIEKPYGTVFQNFFVSDFGSVTTMQRNLFAMGAPNQIPTRTTPTLDDAGADAVAAFSIMSNTIINDLNTQFVNLFSCDPGGCSPQYAGSSSNYPVARSFSGAARVGVPEVGAFESNSLGLSHGVATPITLVNRADSMSLSFTTLNYEPNSALNAYFWWALDAVTPPAYGVGSGAGTMVMDLANFPTKGPLGEVITTTRFGPLNGVGGTTYDFCFGFGSTPPSSPVRCVEFTTPPITVDTCTLNAGNTTRCPEGGNNFFGINHSTLGALTASVQFARPSQGAFDVASGDPPATIGPFSVNTGLPFVTVTTNYSAVNAQDETENYYTFALDLGQPVSLANTEIIRASGGQYFYVPAWTTSGNTVSLESKDGGTFYFINTPASGGILSPAAISGFYTPGLASVTANYTGSGFLTANPLIIATVIPVGSMSGQEVFSNYFAQNIFLNSDIGSLGPALNEKWSERYFRRLKQKYPAAAGPAGFGKGPIDFVGVDSTNFANQIAQLPLPQPVVSGNIALSGVDIGLTQNSGTYVLANSKRKITRGVEIVFTVLDGGRVTMARTVMRTQFTGNMLFGPDRNHVNNDVIILNTSTWHLFTYPWLESAAGKVLLHHVVGDTVGWSDKHYRIYQRNGAAWNIFDGQNTSGFVFDGGPALWVAAVNQFNEGAPTFKPTSESGQSMENQVQTISTAAGAWTEFGLPYNFPMLWQDVVDASSLPVGYEIRAYNPSWKDREGNLTGQEAWPLVTDTTLLPWRGYIFRASQAATLTFPVMDHERSPNSPAPKIAAKPMAAGYEVKITASNATAREAVIVGRSSDAVRNWRPPNIPGQDFSIGLERVVDGSLEVFSKDLLPMEDELENGLEGNWPLNTRVSDASSGFSLQVQRSQNLPDNLRVYLVESLTREVIPLDEDSPVDMTPEQVRNGVYSIAVGSADYARSLVPENLLSFRNTPNPFRLRTTFEYSVPQVYAQGKVDFQLQVFDLQGKRVLLKSGLFPNSSQSLSYHWDGTDEYSRPLPAGSYVVQFKVKSGNYPALTSQRKIVKLN